ncbi:hypothetical protein AK812_SmicGene49151 [Symbiodinium microadriaticum]|uniref:Uncharacterized protein n=1 Tax=Symbiodinium microadriaticum TaxID=2951 RepID=A0A1Q9ESQ3_SYMMI|nr:hypothetical protein AK812_SmicGene49151 [Symbiodinium microadriaticum]
MFCRIWTQPSSKGQQDLNMEEYVILMPWFRLFNVFAVLCIVAKVHIADDRGACPWFAAWLWCDGSTFGWKHHVVGGLQCASGTEHRVLDPTILGHHLRCHPTCCCSLAFFVLRRLLEQTDYSMCVLISSICCRSVDCSS